CHAGWNVHPGPVRPGEERGVGRHQHEERLEAHFLIRTVKEIDMTSQVSRRVRTAGVGGVMAVLVVVSAMAGCTTTQQMPVQRPAAGGFLGNTSLLTPGDKEQTSLRYVNPSVQWTQYKKLLLEPVTFWGDDKTKISVKDQQMLTNFLHEQ